MNDHLIELVVIGVIAIVAILLFRLYAQESGVNDAIIDALGEDDNAEALPAEPAEAA